MADSKDTEQQETLIKFPCQFPIKVVGDSHEAFSSEIVETIQQHETTFDMTKIELKASYGGKYTSITCNCHVESQSQLDNIYRALTSHSMVKFVL